MIICFLPLCSETVTAQRNEEMNFLQVELGARTRRSSFACDVLPLSYLAPFICTILLVTVSSAHDSSISSTNSMPWPLTATNADFQSVANWT